MRRYYSYRDAKKTKVGTTTSVTGVLELSSKTQYQLSKILDNLEENVEKVFRPRDVVEVNTTIVDDIPIDGSEEVVDVLFTKYYEREATSKLDPEDRYDEKTGLVLASRRAEIKTLKAALNDVADLRRTLERMLDEVKLMEDEADFRLHKIELNLIAERGKDA